MSLKPSKRQFVVTGVVGDSATESLGRMVIALGVALVFVSAAHYFGLSHFLTTVE